MNLLGLFLWFTLSFGYQDYTEAGYILGFYTHPPIYTEIELHAQNEWLDIYGIYNNEMEFGDVFFIPIQDYFTVGASVSIGLFSINVEHLCQHPVANVRRDLTGKYGGYNKICITLGTKP